MSRWRELLLIGGLFAALIAFTIYGPGRSQTDPEGERGSTHSTADDGALALQRWLDSIGYNTSKLEYTEWRIPDDAQALLIITPDEQPITDTEAQEIVRWVRQGGTLIAIDERPQLMLAPNHLWTALGASTTINGTAAGATAERATTTQPILLAPPVTSVSVHTSAGLSLEDPNYVTLLQTRFGPTLIGRQEGRGYIYLAVSAHPFTNAGLREPGSAALVLNLLARVPRGAMVLFDEYHHGFGEAAAAAPSLRRIVFRNWWGWAAVYALGVVALYLVLTGRRFGAPVPLQREVARRSSAEYVHSIAQLLQRAGKRASVGQHFHDGLKRRLARQYGLAPNADDEAYVRALVAAGGATPEQGSALQGLLAELRRPDLRDIDLVHAVQSVDRLVDRRGRLR